MKRGALPFLLLLAACPPEQGVRVENRCAGPAECPSGSYCETERGLCAVKKAVQAYPVVLQISGLTPAEGERERWPGRFTFPAHDLLGEELDHDLDVPLGVSVEGRVLGRDADPIRAQVTFTPNDGSTASVRTPIVVTTGDGADTMNLSATLPPDASYQVTIHPMFQSGLELPPAHTTFFSGSTGGSGHADAFFFSYAEAFAQLDRLAATLIGADDQPVANLWVRLLAGPLKPTTDRDTYAYAYDEDEVVSAFGTVGADGHFDIAVLPGVIGARDYRVELNVFEDRPWSTVIEFDAVRVELAKDGKVYVPRPPLPVSVENRIETQALTPAVNANVVFESTYPLPAQPGVVNDRDWCQVKRLGDQGPPFRCRTLLATTTDSQGAFVAALLPGDYQMYVSPSRTTAADRNRSTVSFPLQVDTQAGNAPQAGGVHTLREPAVFVQGNVQGFRGPIPGALIRLLPIGGHASRSSDAVSNALGGFSVPVDVGMYDFITRAPEDSGYPWLYKANRVIDPKDGDGDGDDDTTQHFVIGSFVLPPPLLVSGLVSVDGVAAPGASIDAYAVVRDVGSKTGKRGALIGRATADAEGRYTLTLPPSVADED